MIGGGITGLSAANRLIEEQQARQVPLAVTLLEGSDRLGGTIQTQEVDGFLIETGPDAFISTKPWALALCTRIGLSDRLIRTNETFRRTHIVRKGALLPVPEGFLMLAPTRFWPFVTSPLFSWPGKLRMALDLVLPRGPQCEDESLGSFVTRRLGREALERIAQPLVSGIYTADPDVLSLRATMPRFLDMETQHRSIITAMWREQRTVAQRTRDGTSGRKIADSGARYSLFVSFDRGMKTLIDTLAVRLPGGVAQRQKSVATVRRRDAAWDVVLSDGMTFQADAVLIAVPAHRAAGMVQELDAELAADLSAIPYAPSVVVNLAYRRQDIPHPLDGFGFVVPAIERRSLIACTFSSVKFAGRAPDGWALLRVFIGGTMQAHLCELDDEELLRAVRKDLHDLLGIEAAPRLTLIARHPASMPQYPVGHLQHVARIQARAARYPGLAFIGNAYGGIGMPDCVHAGETAAEQVLERVKERDTGFGVRGTGGNSGFGVRGSGKQGEKK
ncbi:MAG: protoporphyrinogen oxidase [Candidatus Latescibacteria bacterium]|nr:protoporphyrinogen oxidase [Candidatus Latescibacterota bacterium]